MSQNRPRLEKSYKARVSRRRKKYLVAGVILLCCALVASIPLWLPRFLPQTSTIPPEQTQEIDIAHTLTSRNDTGVGVPKSGYVFIDFSLTVMNCGYQSFQVGPSQFDLLINGVKYTVALNATSRLAKPLSPQILSNQMEVSGSLAYEVPAGQVPDIPLTPLVYNGGTFNIQWRSDW